MHSNATAWHSRSDIAGGSHIQLRELICVLNFYSKRDVTSNWLSKQCHFLLMGIHPVMYFRNNTGCFMRAPQFNVHCVHVEVGVGNPKWIKAFYFGRITFFFWLPPSGCESCSMLVFLRRSLLDYLYSLWWHPYDNEWIHFHMALKRYCRHFRTSFSFMAFAVHNTRTVHWHRHRTD